MKKLLLVVALLATLLAPSLLLSGNTLAAAIFTNCGNGSAAGNPDVCQEAQGQKGAVDQDCNPNSNSKEKCKPTNADNPIITIIKGAITVISYIVGAAAVIGVIVSGLRMILAGGNSDAVASARTGLVYSLVGVLVVALAQSLVHFVLDKV